MRNKFLSLIYRLIGVVSRFFLIFILAKLLDEKDFVLYGVIASFVLYLQYAVGLDIYTFANREYVILKSTLFKFRLISKQYSIYFFIYVFVVFPSTIIAALFFDFKLSLLFGFLLISEHLFTEVSRFWIFNSAQVFSSYIYFAKSFLMFCFPICFYLYFDFIDVYLVILFWIISNLIAIYMSFNKFNILKVVSKFFEIDFSWLKIALIFSIPLMASALCSRAAFTFDKSVAGYFLDYSHAASYILVISFFGVMNLVVETVFFNFKAPELILAVRDGFFPRVFDSFLKQGGFVIFFLSIMLLPIGYVAVYFFHEKLSPDNYQSFCYLSVSFFVYSVSQLYHFALYANGLGKMILTANFISFIFIVIVFLTLFFFDFFSVDSIVLSVLSFSIIMLISKYILFKKCLQYKSTEISQ